MRDRIAACLYVRRLQPDRLFGEVEKRVAELLVSLAGAALENAEGFVAVHALSEGLGRRVEELAQELRDTDRRKAEFIGVLSHELRNPLAAIRSAQDVLQRANPVSEQAMRARTIIGRQVEHLDRKSVV